MAKPSDQIGGYLQKKAAYLEELADHHAGIGEKDKAKELYLQAKDLYTRLGDSAQIARVEQKLKQLE